MIYWLCLICCIQSNYFASPLVRTKHEMYQPYPNKIQPDVNNEFGPFKSDKSDKSKRNLAERFPWLKYQVNDKAIDKNKNIRRNPQFILTHDSNHDSKRENKNSAEEIKSAIPHMKSYDPDKDSSLTETQKGAKRDIPSADSLKISNTKETEKYRRTSRQQPPIMLNENDNTPEVKIFHHDEHQRHKLDEPHSLDYYQNRYLEGGSNVIPIHNENEYEPDKSIRDSLRKPKIPVVDETKNKVRQMRKYQHKKGHKKKQHKTPNIFDTEKANFTKAVTTSQPDESGNALKESSSVESSTTTSFLNQIVTFFFGQKSNESAEGTSSDYTTPKENVESSGQLSDKIASIPSSTLSLVVRNYRRPTHASLKNIATGKKYEINEDPSEMERAINMEKGNGGNEESNNRIITNGLVQEYDPSGMHSDKKNSLSILARFANRSPEQTIASNPSSQKNPRATFENSIIENKIMKKLSEGQKRPIYRNTEHFYSNIPSNPSQLGNKKFVRSSDETNVDNYEIQSRHQNTFDSKSSRNAESINNKESSQHGIHDKNEPNEISSNQPKDGLGLSKRSDQKSSIDDKISNVYEGSKSTQRIIKDSKKETKVLENQKETIVDNIHLIKEAKEKLGVNTNQESPSEVPPFEEDSYFDEYDDDDESETESSITILPKGMDNGMQDLNKLGNTNPPLLNEQSNSKESQNKNAIPEQSTDDFIDLNEQEIKKENVLEEELQKFPSGKLSGKPKQSDMASEPREQNESQRKFFEFSTILPDTGDIGEFQREEKVQRQSKVLFKKNGILTNGTSSLIGEKKVEIKDNKQNYHETFMEERGESKFEGNDSNIQKRDKEPIKIRQISLSKQEGFDSSLLNPNSRSIKPWSLNADGSDRFQHGKTKKDANDYVNDDDYKNEDYFYAPEDNPDSMVGSETDAKNDEYEYALVDPKDVWENDGKIDGIKKRSGPMVESGKLNTNGKNIRSPKTSADPIDVHHGSISGPNVKEREVSGDDNNSKIVPISDNLSLRNVRESLKKSNEMLQGNVGKSETAEEDKHSNSDDSSRLSLRNVDKTSYKVFQENSGLAEDSKKTNRAISVQKFSPRNEDFSSDAVPRAGENEIKVISRENPPHILSSRNEDDSLDTPDEDPNDNEFESGEDEDENEDTVKRLAMRNTDGNKISDEAVQDDAEISVDEYNSNNEDTSGRLKLRDVNKSSKTLYEALKANASQSAGTDIPVQDTSPSIVFRSVEENMKIANEEPFANNDESEISEDENISNNKETRSISSRNADHSPKMSDEPYQSNVAEDENISNNEETSKRLSSRNVDQSSKISDVGENDILSKNDKTSRRLSSRNADHKTKISDVAHESNIAESEVSENDVISNNEETSRRLSTRNVGQSSKISDVEHKSNVAESKVAENDIISNNEESSRRLSLRNVDQSSKISDVGENDILSNNDKTSRRLSSRNVDQSSKISDVAHESNVAKSEEAENDIISNNEETSRRLSSRNVDRRSNTLALAHQSNADETELAANKNNFNNKETSRRLSSRNADHKTKISDVAHESNIAESEVSENDVISNNEETSRRLSTRNVGQSSKISDVEHKSNVAESKVAENGIISNNEESSRRLSLRNVDQSSKISDVGENDILSNNDKTSRRLSSRNVDQSSKISDVAHESNVAESEEAENDIISNNEETSRRLSSRNVDRRSNTLALAHQSNADETELAANKNNFNNKETSRRLSSRNVHQSLKVLDNVHQSKSDESDVAEDENVSDNGESSSRLSSRNVDKNSKMSGKDHESNVAESEVSEGENKESNEDAYRKLTVRNVFDTIKTSINKLIGNVSEAVTTNPVKKTFDNLVSRGAYGPESNAAEQQEIVGAKTNSNNEMLSDRIFLRDVAGNLAESNKMSQDTIAEDNKSNNKVSSKRMSLRSAKNSVKRSKELFQDNLDTGKREISEVSIKNSPNTRKGLRLRKSSTQKEHVNAPKHIVRESVVPDSSGQLSTKTMESRRDDNLRQAPIQTAKTGSGNIVYFPVMTSTDPGSKYHDFLEIQEVRRRSRQPHYHSDNIHYRQKKHALGHRGNKLQKNYHHNSQNLKES